MKIMEAMEQLRADQRFKDQSLRRVLFTIKIIRHQFPQGRRIS